jgi:uncharacterized DUF497 family protein
MSLKGASGRIPVRFEFNEFKSRINKRKHGIDFVEAQALWLDLGLVEATARSDAEPRILVIGQLDDKYWSAIITYRGDVIRLISVRRSRPREVAIYESQ